MADKMISCVRCGKPIRQPDQCNRKYCPDCAKIRRRESNRKAQAKLYAAKHNGEACAGRCAICGKPFPAGTSVNRKYCADCGEELHRTQAREAARLKRQISAQGRHKPVDKPCQMCGKLMRQVDLSKKYCADCLRERHNEANVRFRAARPAGYTASEKNVESGSKKTSHESLVDDNAAAIAKGMTYGQYKAWQRRQKELMEREEIGSMA